MNEWRHTLLTHTLYQVLESDGWVVVGLSDSSVVVLDLTREVVLQVTPTHSPSLSHTPTFTLSLSLSLCLSFSHTPTKRQQWNVPLGTSRITVSLVDSACSARAAIPVGYGSRMGGWW